MTIETLPGVPGAHRAHSRSLFGTLPRQLFSATVFANWKSTCFAQEVIAVKRSLFDGFEGSLWA